MEGKLVTAVDELKEPDCEKDAEVEKSDYAHNKSNLVKILLMIKLIVFFSF